MTDSPETSPHFYFDADEQRWISIERSAVPRVLVFSWHADARSMAEALLSHVKALPADLIAVPKDRVCDSVNTLDSDGTVACVLFLSPAALEDASLGRLVHVAEELFRKRPEFRLFVQLANGLTLETLKSMATQGHEVAGALIEDVHFASPGADACDDTARRLQHHLLDLPRIRHRLSRERWESDYVRCRRDPWMALPPCRRSVAVP
jgi:hypothetical protein